MFAKLESFIQKQSGSTSLEYSLLASLIAVVIAGICAAMFYQLSSQYVEVSAIFK